jgi:hypothetical protein
VYGCAIAGTDESAAAGGRLACDLGCDAYVVADSGFVAWSVVVVDDNEDEWRDELMSNRRLDVAGESIPPNVLSAPAAGRVRCAGGDCIAGAPV